LTTESLFDLLRLARTAALRAAGPLDRLSALARGPGDRPPLWLRRHAGPLAAHESSAREMDAWIGELGLVREGDRVVDLGCGAGAMAAPLARRLGPAGSYLGLDVHRPSISWASRHFAADRRVAFEAVAAASPYGGGRGPSNGRSALPVAEGAAQFVLAKSLFTHLLEADAAAYLSEIRRILEPGRAALVTAFLFERGSRADRGLSRSFRHPEPGRPVRWRLRHRPESAVAYERTFFLALVQRAGLREQWICESFLPGDDDVPRGQDLVLLGV